MQDKIRIDHTDIMMWSRSTRSCCWPIRGAIHAPASMQSTFQLLFLMQFYSGQEALEMPSVPFEH